MDTLSRFADLEPHDKITNYPFLITKDTALRHMARFQEPIIIEPECYVTKLDDSILLVYHAPNFSYPDYIHLGLRFRLSGEIDIEINSHCGDKYSETFYGSLSDVYLKQIVTRFEDMIVVYRALTQY